MSPRWSFLHASNLADDVPKYAAPIIISRGKINIRLYKSISGTAAENSPLDNNPRIARYGAPVQGNSTSTTNTPSAAVVRKRRAGWRPSILEIQLVDALMRAAPPGIICKENPWPYQK